MFLVRAINFVISLQNGLYVAVDCTALSHPPSISINSFLVTRFLKQAWRYPCRFLPKLFINFQKQVHHNRWPTKKTTNFPFS